MNVELELTKQSILEEIDRTKHWDTSWNQGRIEGLKFALGLINIGLGVQEMEAKDGNSQN